MKVGDLVRSKRRGWLALILSTNERNLSGDIIWLFNGKIENCSMCVRCWEVISEG